MRNTQVEQKTCSVTTKTSCVQEGHVWKTGKSVPFGSENA